MRAINCRYAGRRRWSLALAIVAAAPAIALAQIYKCVDGSGHTTYQQTPCPVSAKGGKLDVSVDNGATRGNPESDAGWEAAARDKNVSVGMPRRYVRLAYGTPRDIRPGRANENAAEVWSYPRPDSAMLVIGFRNDAVAWLRQDVGLPDGSPAPDDEATQRMLRRRNVSAGQECGDVSSQLGPPDESDSGSGASGARAPDDPATAIIRYTWEPGPGDPYTRTIVTCASGRVTSVDRISVR